MKEKFTWVPFYKELAEKLLEYKNNRKELVNIVFGMEKQYVDYIHLDDGSYYPDLDPFTIFGIFNRKITDDKRIKICNYFKESLNLKSNIPLDFEGLPIMHPQMSIFVWREYIDNVTPLLWDLFEIALQKEYDKNTFIEKFNLAINQKGIRWNITIGLFWINPFNFISLDGKSREYLPRINIGLFNDKDFSGERYLNLINSVKEKINKNEIEEQNFIELSYNAWKSNLEVGDDEIMRNTDYSKYVALLKQNRNIILHGAPGTGKTYLAKEIAKAMGCKEDEENPKNSTIGFVQFHPSYDYTDFVEGLRPTAKDENGNILFERKDGIFKEFCKRALNNFINSKKTKERIGIERKNEIKLKSFLQDTFDKNLEFELVRGNSFYINSYTDEDILITVPKNAKKGEITLKIQFLLDLLNSEKEYNSVSSVGRTQESSYYYVLLKKIKDFTSVDNTLLDNYVINREPFVFIIDEINRGELSKIFGELFFTIDPGYRGKKGNVKTQYQNLIESSNTYANGFYIPENVYIIGTMNDIDRSVESMDFAMRRRFAFVEVTAKESADNMGLSEESRKRMNAINEKIETIDGLNKSYDIGGSYFLKVDKPNKGEEAISYEDLWKYHLEGLIREYLRGIMAPDEQEKTLKDIKSAYDNAE